MNHEPTLLRLDVSQRGVEIHEVLMDAYRAEAALLGVTYFPPLGRTVAHMEAAHSTFLGACVNAQLVGVIEYDTRQDGLLELCSLGVIKEATRKGVARARQAHDQCEPCSTPHRAGDRPRQHPGDHAL